MSAEATPPNILETSSSVAATPAVLPALPVTVGPPSLVVHTTIPIGGMTCASCAARITKVVGRLDGVADVNVNLATEKATVGFDPERIRLPAIKQAIVKAGYVALDPPAVDALGDDRRRKRHDVRTMWAKFLVAAVFALPLLYLAMGPMVSRRLPVPFGLGPVTHPLAYACAQLALVADPLPTGVGVQVAAVISFAFPLEPGTGLLDCGQVTRRRVVAGAKHFPISSSRSPE